MIEALYRDSYNVPLSASVIHSMTKNIHILLFSLSLSFLSSEIFPHSTMLDFLNHFRLLRFCFLHWISRIHSPFVFSAFSLFKLSSAFFPLLSMPFFSFTLPLWDSPLLSPSLLLFSPNLSHSPLLFFLLSTSSFSISPLLPPTSLTSVVTLFCSPLPLPVFYSPPSAPPKTDDPMARHQPSPSAQWLGAGLAQWTTSRQRWGNPAIMRVVCLSD